MQLKKYKATIRIQKLKKEKKKEEEGIGNLP